MGDKGVHAFPKSIYLKVNVIARLTFELAYNDVVVQHVSHYTTGTHSSMVWMIEEAFILEMNF